MKMKINFFQKIFIFSIAIILITIFFSYTLNVLFLDQFYVQKKSARMNRISGEIQKKLESPDISVYEFGEYLENFSDKEGIKIELRNINTSMMEHHNGKVIFFDGRRQRRGDPMKVIGAMKNNTFVVEIGKSGPKMLVLEKDVSSSQRVFMTTSLSAINTYKSEIYYFNIIVSIISVLISTVIGKMFSKRITSDIGKLNSVAKKISVLDFSEKLNIVRNDEIGELSSSISDMSENLESSIENLKSFASNASHELKTPITVINAYAQALATGIITKEEDKKIYYKNILSESIEMKDLVNNLLTISRLSSPGIKLKDEDISVRELITNSIEKYEILELESDIMWDISKEDKIIKGDKKLLKTAFDNIIQNALKYSEYNSKIIVDISDKNIKVINVMNGEFTGDMEKLWEPFTRGVNATDSSKEGNGLGLSIVKMILKLNRLDSDIEIKNGKFIFNISIK